MRAPPFAESLKLVAKKLKKLLETAKARNGARFWEFEVEDAGLDEDGNIASGNTLSEIIEAAEELVLSNAVAAYSTMVALSKS